MISKVYKMQYKHLQYVSVRTCLSMNLTLTKYPRENLPV